MWYWTWRMIAVKGTDWTPAMLKRAREHYITRRQNVHQNLDDAGYSAKGLYHFKDSLAKIAKCCGERDQLEMRGTRTHRRLQLMNDLLSEAQQTSSPHCILNPMEEARERILNTVTVMNLVLLSCHSHSSANSHLDLHTCSVVRSLLLFQLMTLCAGFPGIAWILVYTTFQMHAVIQPACVCVAYLSVCWWVFTPRWKLPIARRSSRTTLTTTAQALTAMHHMEHGTCPRHDCVRR